MSTKDDLFLSILAMDSYNRGYDPGLGQNGVGLGGPGTYLGNALVLNALLPPDSEDAGFFASAYQIGSQTVISYRGTDSTLELPLTDFPIIGGDYNEAQVYMAAQFYNTVRDQVGQNAAITLTGHSLGGALAGFVAGLYGQRAVLVDHIDFYEALVNFQTDYQLYVQFTADPQAYQNYVQNGGDFLLSAFQSHLDAMGIGAGDTPLLFNLGAVSSFFLEGSVAEAVHGVFPSVASFGGMNFTAGGGTIGAIGAHSVSLNVLAKYAELLVEQHGSSAARWTGVATLLIEGLFDDDLAEALGIPPADTDGSSGAAGKMLSMIAYSAIDTGARPYGDTAIRALFDDANEFGRFMLSGTATYAVDMLKWAISDAIVSFAGQLAHGGILQSEHPEAIEGVAAYDPETGLFGMSLDTALWQLGSGGQPESAWSRLSESVFRFATFGENAIPEMNGNAYDAAFYPVWDDAIPSGLFWGIEDPANTPLVIDSITFQGPIASTHVAISDGPLWEGSHGAGVFNMFVGSDSGDQIDGSSSSDIIIGSGGNDVVNGGDGADMLYGGNWADGNDYLYGGAGDDTLFSGGSLSLGPGNGTDILDGGDGDDLVWLSVDGEQDLAIVDRGWDHVVGGDENDRLLVRFSTLKEVAWILENGTLPQPDQFADDQDEAIAIRGGVAFADQAYSATSSMEYNWGTWTTPGPEGSVIYHEGYQDSVSWGEDYWDGSEPPFNLDIILRSLGGSLAVDVMLDVVGGAIAATSATAILLESLGYLRGVAYQSGSDTMIMAFKVFSTTIEDFEDGDFGINLFSEASLEAFQHIWNNGVHFSVPDALGEIEDGSASSSNDPSYYATGIGGSVGTGTSEGNSGTGMSGDDTINGSTGNDVLQGLAGNDVLNGAAGNDAILGGDGDDEITGGVGDDDLAGGSGNDVFVFSGSFGSDRIADFDDSAGAEDQIDLTEIGIADFASLQESMEEEAGNVRIELAGGLIVIENTLIASLSVNDFIL